MKKSEKKKRWITSGDRDYPTLFKMVSLFAFFQSKAGQLTCNLVGGGDIRWEGCGSPASDGYAESFKGVPSADKGPYKPGHDGIPRADRIGGFIG